MSLRLVFMGTPAFAVPTLAEILGAGHEVVAVYAQPPRPAGRGMEARKSPVHSFAAATGLPVLTPASLKGAAEQQAFAAHGADAAVVVAYGLILPPPVLSAPRHGCLNLHASALPRWRGAAPIQRALMAGDTETAVMVMRMDEGLDTGPVCLVERMAIGPDTTAGELHDELARRGASLIVRALAALERGSLVATPQPVEGVTYAAKIDKAEARIDFSRPAPAVHNLIRALSPFPGAWFETGPEGRRERIKVLRSQRAEGQGRPGEILDDALTVACGEGAVRLIEVQRAGRKPTSAAELLRGFPLPKGTQLQGLQSDS
jgi:methionyl-tRNA formyltransferase